MKNNVQVINTTIIILVIRTTKRKQGKEYKKIRNQVFIN